MPRGDVFSMQRLNPTRGVGSTQAIEACHLLESITSAVSGQPGFRASAAVAGVQEASFRPLPTERWEPVADEE